MAVWNTYDNSYVYALILAILCCKAFDQNGCGHFAKLMVLHQMT